MWSLNRGGFHIPMGSAAARARGEDLAEELLVLGQALLPEPRARMDVGSGSLVPCRCAQSWILGWLWGGAFPLAGEVQGRARILEEALEPLAQFLLCLKFSLQPSFFLQIHPGIYCFSFLQPAPDFWAALPQEGAFGRLGGSCHASKHPSGILPAGAAGFSRGRFRAELPRGPWPAR